MSDDLVQQETDKNQEQRLDIIRKRELIDAKFGYQRIQDVVKRNAWLINIQGGELFDELNKSICAVADFYFMEDNGTRFKISYPFRPYLYIATTPGMEMAVAAYLNNRHTYIEMKHVEKEDLDLKNHLSGLKSRFIRISFASTAEMGLFKKEIMPIIKKNKEILKNTNDYTKMLGENIAGFSSSSNQEMDIKEQIIDIREYDLPYQMRLCIDERLFVGLWYTVQGKNPTTRLPSIQRNEDIVDPPDPVVCAFDIETAKSPLKFPNSEVDPIIMISYMIDGEGFLIINREIVSEDVEDFEYTPRPEFRGEFKVFNESNEASLIRTFFNHLLRVQPQIMVTYNGDFFDWPYVEARAEFHKISMSDQIGFFKDSQDEYKHCNCIHMDAFKWVVRDSYLPMGSQNLKATTRAKLRYDPVELDPEKMMEMACYQPKILANYSVSDAVATYYLYMKYVHPFIFALCTIIPLGPDDVLRKGSGTLCEALLMVEAFHKNIIFPNKQISNEHSYYDGHLLDSETYVGGHVEALETGIYKADIPVGFKLDKDTLLELKEKVKTTMTHAITVEMGTPLNEIVDFDEVCAQIENQLNLLYEKPLRNENPKIYHLDVGAMYPNIILTNRLQPTAVVQEEDCLSCVYNETDAKCKRKMDWVWRGELAPLKKDEHDRLMLRLEKEKFGKFPNQKSFNQLSREERAKYEKQRVQDYCRKAYAKLRITRVEPKTTTICQRENAFYVNTVKAFRDRRYDYKAMLKKVKNAVADVPKDDLVQLKLAQARVVLYDSLQLAHKCILNSFYGYVMRRGSRWFSMQMAGIVCHTGANIIREARKLVELIGRPLELDTDGIWCLLPSSFPENFNFKTKNEKMITVSYPGAMLNELVKDKFTNNQYHNLQDDGTYKISKENSIFFEVDGPYLAMVLPASKEEGKKLKKRYAVFDFDGSVAELKGFEVKRRGELAIIKHFQTAVFKAFLNGKTLLEIYGNVAKEADYWLDILYSKGVDLPNEELFELIGENRSMSKKLEEYGAQKSTSITTAKRLAEFLGDSMTKNAGLACRFIISKFPMDAPVTERTIPLAIFQAEPKITCHYLRKWTKNSNINVNNIDIRELIDWPYYLERLGSCIQKIVTIPAALQGVPNPVPRVLHPKWLENKRKERLEKHLQPKITEMMIRNKPSTSQSGTPSSSSKFNKTTTSRKRPLYRIADDDNESDYYQIMKRSQDDEENFNGTNVATYIGITNSQQQSPSCKRTCFSPPTTTTNTTTNNDNAIVHHEEEEEVDIVNEILNNPPSDEDTENNLEQFHQRKPMKGKKFARKNGKIFTNQKDLTLTKFNAMEKKTWAKDGFYEWLKYMKIKWQIQQNEQKNFMNQKLEDTGEFSGTPIINNFSRTPQLARNGAQILHIIQIRETKILGQFTVFAFSDGAIRRFNLTIPKTVYVDDIIQRAENETCKSVQKILPKMRPSSYLYEFTFDEAIYAAKINELNAQLCETRINGIYETEIPPLFKALVKIGSMCQLRGLKNPNSNNLLLNQLHRIPSQNSEYVKLNEIHLIFFYEFTHNKRSIMTIFMPFKAQCYLFVVNKVPVELNNLNRLYKTLLEKHLEKHGEDIPIELIRNIQIELIQTITIKEANNQLQNVIKKMKLSPTDPTIFCLQSSRSNSELNKEFPILQSYAQIRIGANAEPTNQMNILDWANVMAKRAIQHFLNSFTYLKDYMVMAHYTGIPVGNLPQDLSTLTLDVFYARQLLLRNHILWASPSSKPDFGGKEVEDLRLGNDWETIAFKPNSSYIYNKETFEPENIVVELKLSAVAITALLQNTRIAEAEGTSEAVSYSAGYKANAISIEDAMSHRLALTNYDETVAVSGALTVLKEVFQEIVNDIRNHENVIADSMANNMHRWLRDPNSYLYSPAISSTVSNLMRKLYLLLVAEINRLGGTVIHCSFTRIVLSTNRNRLNLAKGFVESLINSLNEKPLFMWLSLHVVRFSKMFIWIDSTNFGFIKCDEIEKTIVEDENSITNLQPNQVRLYLSMAKYFPKEIYQKFRNLIADFLAMLNEKLYMEEKISTDEFENYSNEMLMENLAPKLFTVTTKLMENRQKLQAYSVEQKPIYLKNGEAYDIPLDFVRNICKVLSVIKCIERNVENVRCQLMRILSLDDALPITVWKPPPIALIFQYVYCKECNQNADLNLWNFEVDPNQDGILEFKCSLCGENLSSTLIEEMLLERVSKLILSFNLQDYKCVKCKQIGQRYLANHCECSNRFEGTISIEEFELNLRAIISIAKRHSLKNLEFTIEQIFQYFI